MVQLDSLRTIAVLAVMGSHFAGKYFQFFNWGYAGVFLFFVLSGFLITGILLRAREKDEKTQSPKINSLKWFYIRRTIRIFPLYYAIVVVSICLFPAVRETWAWHLSYAVNFQMALVGKWIGITGPFWSLGVEEQFYLIWPLIMLFTPLRWLSTLLFALIVAGPFSRFLCVASGANPMALLYLPTSCLDALGLGSLLAYSRHSFLNGKFGQLPFGYGCLLGLVSEIVLLWLPRTSWNEALLNVLSPFLMSLIFVWLVSRCAIGFTGVVGRVLEWKPSVYLGKISYGLYALHLLADKVMSKVFAIMSMTPSDTIHACASFVATVFIASLSWFLFERPINNLKDRLSNPTGYQSASEEFVSISPSACD